jgi:phosphatidylserine synthase
MNTNQPAAGLRQSPVLAAMNLPSAVTLLGACGGGAALIGAARGRPLLIVGGIALALLTDKLDGLLARRLQQQSDFGAQLDSLADSLAFVAAPALTVALLIGGAVGPLLGALYLLCGIGRLAAFHSIGVITVGGRACFVGLPTPAAAAAFLVALTLRPYLGVLPMALCLAATAPLMISRLPWPKRGLHDVFCASSAALAIALALWGVLR